MTNLAELVTCGECGMPCTPNEYHPFAACLMFKACHDSRVVRANLESLAQQPQAGEWVLVPREPTPEMLDGMSQATFDTSGSHKEMARRYNGMLQAAPPAPSAGDIQEPK